MVSATTLGLTAVAVVCGILYAWRKCRVYKFFDKMGIKGPKPVPFMGNYLAMSKLGFTECQKVWAQEYGKIYGAFFGLRPTLFIEDLDLIREIMVKQFPAFCNHSTEDSAKPWSDTLLNMKGDHWKHTRRIITPCFSASKLKKTVPSIQRAVGNLVSNVNAKAESGEEVELKKLAGCYEMDLLAALVFGLQVDSLKNPEDPFFVHANKIMNPSRWVILVVFLLPFLKPVLKLFDIQLIDRKSTEWFLHVADQAIELRKTDSQSQYSDVLQLLVDAEKGETGEVDPEIFHEDHLKTSSSWSGRGITRDEMKGNCLGFLLGGYDTSATTFSFTLFCLAANPQCLEKVQQEIDTKMYKGPIDYDTVSSLQYLDMCISETLRLYPPAFMMVFQNIGKPFMVLHIIWTLHRRVIPGSTSFGPFTGGSSLMDVSKPMHNSYTPARSRRACDCMYAIHLHRLDRRSTQDSVLGGIHVPASTAVAVPVYAIHTDPAIWPDPLQFDPERHTAEQKRIRHPYSYMPFGQGPRNCVGMRLSQLELKIALASVLQRFSPVLCDKSVYPPKLIKFGRLGAIDGLWVKFQARS